MNAIVIYETTVTIIVGLLNQVLNQVVIQFGITRWVEFIAEEILHKNKNKKLDKYGIKPVTSWLSQKHWLHQSGDH